MISEAELRLILPLAKYGTITAFVGPINTVLEQYGIDTTERQAAFLATVAVETSQLNYMAEVWGPTTAQKRYDPPSDLAERLGNIVAGDGFKFRGRGLLMLTGRGNYARASTPLGYSLVDNPDVVEISADWAAATAGWFWSDSGLNAIADTDDIRAVTLAVNGGLNGIADRSWFYAKATEVLSA